jgi:predicted GNAT family acetyltransferase
MKVSEAQAKALEALARDGDTYAIDDPRATLITDGKGFSQPLDQTTLQELRRTGLIASRHHPRYYFITARGIRALERAGR